MKNQKTVHIPLQINFLVEGAEITHKFLSSYYFYIENLTYKHYVSWTLKSLTALEDGLCKWKRHPVLDWHTTCELSEGDWTIHFMGMTEVFHWGEINNN